MKHSYHIRCDPELGSGFCAMRRIPCACCGCVEQLSKPWLHNLKKHNNHVMLSNQGCAVTRTKAQPAGPRDSTALGISPPEDLEQKGDLLIRDLWANGTDSFHDMRVVNTDTKSYWGRTPEKYLEETEKGKKKMYLEACLQKRRHFSPFVASVDGILGVEATATLKRIASRLASKWKQPYLQTCGYVTSRVAITMMRGDWLSFSG